MKKVAYLMTMILALALVSTSCCKDDDDIPNVITVNDLVGDWNFQSLTFDGGYGVKVYDTEAELDQLDANYSYVEISLVNVTTTVMGLLDHRGSSSPYDDTYTLSNNIINFSNNKLVFYIENWETFDGTVLKLKLNTSTATTSAPIGGVYTMVR